jgi:hypothetical protein
MGFLTPTGLFQYAPLGAIPKADVPGRRAGTIGTVTHTGASPATVTITGWPVDVVQFKAKVTTACDIGTAKIAFSTDNGATYGVPIQTELVPVLGNAGAFSWSYEIGDTGLIFTAAPGTGTDFILNDTWACTTTASPWIMTVCAAADAYHAKWRKNTIQATVTAIDEADKLMLYEWVRWKLAAGRGDVPEDWTKAAETAIKHFKMESDGDLPLNTTPDPDSFVFPDIQQPRPAWKNASGWVAF